MSTPTSLSIPRSSGSFERANEFISKLRGSAPLVSLPDIKAHLLIISAFTELLRGVDSSLVYSRPTNTLQAFLSRAIHRYELWITCILDNSLNGTSIQRHELPPLDVALMLHSFMLSPHRYYEDSISRYPQLLSAGPFPLTALAQLIDPIDFKYKPSVEQRAHWVERTKVAFEPDLFRSENPNASVICPSCTYNMNVPWENDGSGLGETGFSTICANCGTTVTRDRLCVAKFLSSLRDIITSETSVLPGTLLDNRGNESRPKARAIALEVIAALQSPDGSLTGLCDLEMADIAKKLYSAENTKLKPDRIHSLLRPYSQATPFTHDIARSVVLQQELNLAIVKRGWSSAKYLSGPCTELNTAYEQYCKFLELATCPEKGRIVPTQDIDLIWHTHQLSGLAYREITIRLLDVCPDHIPREEDPIKFERALECTVERLGLIMSSAITPTLVMITEGGDTSCGGTSMSQDFIFDDDDLAFPE